MPEMRNRLGVEVVPLTHEALEWLHNVREHARHEHIHGAESDSLPTSGTLEPWAEYDLAVMPRGV